MGAIQKVIKIGVEARAELMKGADFLADIVESTMGPHGQNFLLEKGNKITNDGKNIAAELSLPDEIQNRGLIITRMAGIATEEEVFDASSTAISLTRSIAKEAAKQLPNEKQAIGKMTPGSLIKKIEAERVEITEKLIAMATAIETKEQLIASARVSVEDEELAELIGTAQWDLGPNGVILAEETIDPKCSIEMVKGVRIDNGFSTKSTVNNHEKQTLEAKKIPILYTNNSITNLLDIKDIYFPLAQSGVKEFAIIARAFSVEAIQACIENCQSGFNIYPINAAYVDQVEVMKDLEAVLGGKFIDSEHTPLKDIQLSDIGLVNTLEVGRWNATFTGMDDEKTKERIEKRVALLQETLKGNLSVFEKKNLEVRLAQLTTGFAILKVGSSSVLQRKRLKDKADDAVGAVRMAFQEGVVPGAGLAFKQIAETLPEGYILKRPIQRINEIIMASAPVDFVVEDWVKDPVKVLRTALKYASETAANLATAAGADAVKNEKPRYVEEVK